MQRKAIFGVMMAASLSVGALAGCQMSVPVIKNALEKETSSIKVAPASSTASTALPTAKAEQDVNAMTAEEVQNSTAQLSVDAASDERTVEDYALMLDSALPAAYRVLQVQADATASATITASAAIAPQPPVGAKPPVAGKPPMPGQPPMMGKPPLLGQPPVAGMPPMMGKPGMPGQPPMMGKPMPMPFKEKLDEKVRAQMESHHQEMTAKAKERLDKRKDEQPRVHEAARAAKWTDNGDGTKTMVVEFDVDKDGVKRHLKAERTVKSEGMVLVHAKMEMTEQLPDGKTKTVVHEKTLQADGSYVVSFQSEKTGKEGAKQQANWSKTITIDGQVKGEGKILIADKQGKTKEVVLSLNGSDDAPSLKARSDDDSTTEVKISASGAPEAKVTDAKGMATAISFDPSGRFKGRMPGRPGMEPGKSGEAHDRRPEMPGRPDMEKGKSEEAKAKRPEKEHDESEKEHKERPETSVPPKPPVQPVPDKVATPTAAATI